MTLETQDTVKASVLRYNEVAARKDPAANMGRPYQQCSISVLDTISDPHITFDEKGISNYYYEYQEAERKGVVKGSEGIKRLEQLIAAIKESGRNKRYDCIAGVSGGVDSTYLSYMARQWGLRPLIVHFDNGWNSELAVRNIENIISKLGFDLYTLVVDWEEFKDLQLAYIKASVVDIEAITDHAIFATLNRLAVEHDIKYILSGSNVVTEATLPSHWIWSKSDHVNIQDIHKKYGTVPLKTYPFLNKRLKETVSWKKIQVVYPLNYIEYNKPAVKKTIQQELGWRDYGGKHYESVFTRFYQGYILPVKFNIDKRKAHLSNLIFSGQISKEAALKELEEPIYPPEVFATDYEFVLKKFNLTPEEFNEMMKRPRREHTEFATERSLFDQYPILKPLRSVRKVMKAVIHKLMG
ncbi:MAG TPA: N-acetyl sugar amidotransferase [Chitinophagaceae bacterium]|nr:N-acetyl sugar amidotransferase [Chitinophagaceae bacterium]